MLLFTVALLAASAGAEPAGEMPQINPQRPQSFCPETPMSLARKLGKRPQAVPLAKLPTAQTFMAVDRRIAGCPAPLTMTNYRRGGQR